MLEHKEELDKWLQIELPTAPMSRKIINLPTPKTAFTGRDKELVQLRELCSNGGRVAIVGLGGIGKTALAVHYANEHQAIHPLVCFIPSTTSQQIETGLLNLANELKVPEIPIDQRLLMLKTRLEERDDRSLLIFDGVDDEQALAYLKDRLPQRGCVSLLLSSRLKDSTQSTNFTHVNLQSLTVEEAVEFLLKSVDDKDTDQTQATLLATKLGCLPLALTHAAAYIKLTPGYTFKAYNDELADSLEILDPLYNRGEQTVLTTWRKSIETIKAKCRSSLPEEILQFLSVLGNAAIPMDIVSKRFSSVRALQRDLALRELGNYCLLDCSVDSCSLHSLLQQVIRYQLENTLAHEHLFSAFDIFNHVSKDIDLRNPSVCRKMDPYIPHSEFILESLKSAPLGSENVDFYLLVNQIWNYYVNDGKHESSKKIAKIGLILGNIRPLPLLEKAKILHNLGNSLIELGRVYRCSYTVSRSLSNTK